MGKCKFDLAWIGSCKQEADDSGFCATHQKEKCQVCGGQATRQCEYTGQFVCGVPLCDNCEGYQEKGKPSGVWGFMNHRHGSQDALKPKQGKES